MNRSASAFALLLASTLLAGCNGAAPDEAAVADGDTEAPLPGPEGRDGGSVTGMPDTPGPNPAPAQPLQQAAPALTPLDAVLPPPDGNPAATTAGLPAMTAPEPVPNAVEPNAADAVAVVHDYYAALAAGRFEQAYGLWAGDGEASGQSAQQFASGFANVASLSVDVLEPGRVEPAAGSRYIEVPVALTTVHHDGSRHRYVGAYTLRRSVVDGASEEQRAWRLQSADIREVRL
jgi:hypothetical protein